MTVYLVGAGPGDPGLLTRRGAELLAAADVVVYDRLVDRSLLALAPPGAELVDVGKVPGAGATARGASRQDEIHELLVARGSAGKSVVRLKGGDPFVFGRGGEEVEALRAAGVDVEVVPGVTSAFAAPAAAGVPVTHRGLSASVSVVTGHVGDPSAPGGVDWESLARAGGTLVVLMGMATRAEIAQRLLAAGRPPDTPVTVVEWGTTPSQRVVRSRLGELGGVALGSPSVIVVGAVAGLDLGAVARAGTAPPPLAGASVVVTRPAAGRDSLSSALTAAGAHVVALPAVEIEDPEDGGAALDHAARAVGTYRWVVFTSAQAVDRFVPLLRDARAFGQARVAAVGDATAESLRRHGIVADLVPARSSAEGLAESFPLPDVPGAGVLFPAAAGARPTVPSALRAKGWRVDEVAAYRTVAAPAPPAALVPVVAAADAVTFASPSALDAYVSWRTDDGRPFPVPPVVACIGPVTASAARAAGLSVAVEAARPSAGAVVDALARALREVADAGGGERP